MIGLELYCPVHGHIFGGSSNKGVGVQMSTWENGDASFQLYQGVCVDSYHHH
jgi:hypothetical protein